MASKNCAACDDLRQDAPLFVINGLGDTECTSLQNDTGLNPSSGNDDFTDLTNMNDCLVGNMAEEIDSYSSCDWKDFEKRFVPNVWTVFKGIICSIKGLWTNIKSLIDTVQKLQCYINTMSNGASFSFGEYTTEGKSHIVAGRGVSFLQVDESGTSSNILIRYVAGGIATIGGSLIFHTQDFTDQDTVWNFDTNGVNPRQSKSRKGNSAWGEAGKAGDIANGELVYELRILKSEYPQIKYVFGGLGVEGAGSAYSVKVEVGNGGSYIAGQRGWCNSKTGDPVGESDRGHYVPEGWIYIQVRISYLDMKLIDGHQYSPVCLMPIRMNLDAADC